MRVGVVAIGVLLSATAVPAQERLVGARSGGIGASLDLVSFGDGARQYAFGGLDSVRVLRVSQLTVPVAASSSLGAGWRLDVTALHSQGRVTYKDAAGGARHAVALGGMSDVRLRATGRLVGDALTVTLGSNIPTGRTDLDGSRFSALRVLAAPALALGSTPVGTGPSGTVGVVLARQAGPWSLAGGASYEHRGTYQPIAALVAGAPSADYRPGGVARASFGAERLVGQGRLSLALATDVFAQDRLRGIAEGSSPGAAPSTLATVRLGPVLTADAQWQLGTTRWRDVVLYGSYLWRAAYARDGITATGSSGRYVEGGVRGGYPLRPRTDLVVAASGRWHSGLEADGALTTAGVRAADVTMGLRARRGLLSAEPFVRAQGGTLVVRSGLDTRDRPGFIGLTTGLVLHGTF